MRFEIYGKKLTFETLITTLALALYDIELVTC